MNAANVIAYMDSLWVQLIRGRDKPDLIVADNNSYRYYMQAMQAIQRVSEAAPDLAQAGYSSLKFADGTDVVLDGGYQGQSNDPLPYQTSGSTTAVGGAASNTMHFLNTNYLHWRPHSARNMVPLDPDRFSINQDAMVRLVGWAGNMTISNCFLQGIITT